MRDVTHRRAEYQRLLARLVELWRDPKGIDRPEIEHVNSRLRDMLREDGIRETFPHGATSMIAALYVQTDGCYFGLPNVDPWDEARDARTYSGPVAGGGTPAVRAVGATQSDVDLRDSHLDAQMLHRLGFGISDGKAKQWLEKAPQRACTKAAASPEPPTRR